ncbi:N-acetylmuramoyl-L-alanine amidase [Myxococcus stipitatus]|uniref:N-acetylmuramoyl-L-alanine amidase family protein n=1 Tax=Myxococcus stipitatus TaxID=83455 RepID=UPI001F1BDAC2|nr:N-acetylmuramoyl-L-alanine amidase [Myxococcus stipitatus]MCE9671227.1 N-acetylmuramoyl-L-alanine amidase [Myxococcus stipitatus]
MKKGRIILTGLGVLALVIASACVRGALYPKYPKKAWQPTAGPWNARAPLAGATLCIDPGHGGEGRFPKEVYTGGTKGVVSGQTEGAVNLRVAQYLQQDLRLAGAKVEMTRTEDVRCGQAPDRHAELLCRSDFSNAKNCDVFISIHHDFTPTDIPGFRPERLRASRAYIAPGDELSLPLAQNIVSALSQGLGTFNKGVMPSSLVVLKNARMLAVLVEVSPLNDPEEDQRLSRPEYNQKAARAIALGVLNYLRVAQSRDIAFREVFPPSSSELDSQVAADESYVRAGLEKRWTFSGLECDEVLYGIRGEIRQRRFLRPSSRFREEPAFALIDLVHCE